MELEINQKKHNFSLTRSSAQEQSASRVTVEVVMAKLHPGSNEGIAVALWGQVIARTDWAATYLKEGDKLLILTATQGG